MTFISSTIPRSTSASPILFPVCWACFMPWSACSALIAPWATRICPSFLRLLAIC